MPTGETVSASLLSGAQKGDFCVHCEREEIFRAEYGTYFVVMLLLYELTSCLVPERRDKSRFRRICLTGQESFQKEMEMSCKRMALQSNINVGIVDSEISLLKGCNIMFSYL